MLKLLPVIPWSLIISRIALAPVAAYWAYSGAPRWLWMVQFIFAALSDWLDGKLARRWNCVSANLRQADSVADTIYAVGILISLWFTYPSIVIDHAWGLATVAALEVLRYPLDWYLFGRGASYHALSARLFGAAILVCITSIMGFGYVGMLLWITLAIGVVSEIEGILISLALPRWTHDVKHLGQALAIRKKVNLGTPQFGDTRPNSIRLSMSVHTRRQCFGAAIDVLDLGRYGHAKPGRYPNEAT